MTERKEDSEKQTAPQTVGSKGVLFAIALACATMLLTFYITDAFFGIKIGGNPGIPPYFIFRLEITLILSIIFVPGSIFAERLSSKERKRPFRPKNILLFSAFFMEVLAVILSLSFVLEFLLPNPEFVPTGSVVLFAAISTVGMLSFGLTVRAIDKNPRLHRTVERWIS